MEVKKIGVLLVQTVGKEHKPQTVIQADIEKCPWCGVEIIARVATEGTEHFQEGFQETIDKATEQGRIYFVHEKIIPRKD